MTDRIIALLALAGLFTFVGVVVVFVGHIDLIIVVTICCVMAAYDFYRQLFVKK